MAAISLTAALALAPAACGGGSDSTSSTSTSSSTSSTSSTSTSTSTGTRPEPTALRKQFNSLISEALTEAQGLSQSQARCAIRILDREVSDEQIEAAAQQIDETGEAPGDVIDIAYNAGIECAGG